MFTRRLPLLLALGILIVGSLGFLASIDEDVEAVGAPAITITLHQSKQTAYVAPGDDGIVIFTGTVTAVAPWSPDVQTLIVHLEADAGGWVVTNPPAMEFTKGVTEQDFAVTVQAPPETSHMVQGTLTISGKWRYSPGTMQGSIDETTALIYIDQYFDCDLDTSTPSLEAEKGGNAEFIVDAINNGNANDDMTIEIINLEHLVSEDINIQLSDHVIAVPEQQSREISIIATVHDSASIGGYTITVHVSSKLAEEVGKPCDTDTIDLYLEVVREITEPEEPEPEPEEPVEDPEVPVEDPEVPQEEPDTNGEDPLTGGTEEEAINDVSTDDPENNIMRSLGMIALLLFVGIIMIVIIAYIRSVRSRR